MHSKVRAFLAGPLICLFFVLCGCGGAGDPANSNSSGSGNGSGSGSGTPKPRSNASISDKNIMKQVAMGMHNFHDTRKAFPFSKKIHSKLDPKTSWRAHLVPYLVSEGKDKNELEKLYGFVEKGDPLTAEAKEQLVAKWADHYSLSNGSLIAGIRLETRVDTFFKVTDGTSRTVMLIENPNLSGADWMDENDVTIDEAIQMIRKLKPGENLIAALFDGSIVTIPSQEESKTTDEQLRRLLDPRDGQTIELDQMLGH